MKGLIWRSLLAVEEGLGLVAYGVEAGAEWVGTLRQRFPAPPRWEWYSDVFDEDPAW